MFSLGFLTYYFVNSHACLVPSVSSNSLLVSHLSIVSSSSSLSTRNATHQYPVKLKHPSRASAEGAPSELIEDSKFVPLNADDPVYGPPVWIWISILGLLAVALNFTCSAKDRSQNLSISCKALLLLGFEVEEADKMRQLLKELGGEFLKIIFCTEDMIPRSLWEAMHTSQPELKKVKVAKSVPRICFLSGLSGEEMMMFIDAFPETGLEKAVFAALVPNSANKPLQEVIEEIMGDHEMLAS